MNSIAKPKIRMLRTSFLMLLSLLLGLATASAVGHEWNIDGHKLNAKVVDVSTSHLLLEDDTGERKSFRIDSLNASDLQYLTNLMSIRYSEINRQIQMEQLQQQKLQNQLQYFDIWRVSMMASNGETGWRNYVAGNSFEAETLALQDFPHAQVLSTTRLRRSANIPGAINMMPGEFQNLRRIPRVPVRFGSGGFLIQP